jgi:hypothetical protein
MGGCGCQVVFKGFDGARECFQIREPLFTTVLADKREQAVAQPIAGKARVGVGLILAPKVAAVSE